MSNGYDEGFVPVRQIAQMAGTKLSDSGAFDDASFGYDGYYVDSPSISITPSGFQRGYEDGYYGRSQYGSYSDGRYSILGEILSAILNIQSY